MVSPLPETPPTLPPGKKTEQLLGWAISFDHMDNKNNLLLCLHIILLFFHFLSSNSFSLYLPLSLFPCVLKLKPSQQRATHIGNKVGRLTKEKNENTMSLLVFLSLHLVTSVCHTIHLLPCTVFFICTIISCCRPVLLHIPTLRYFWTYVESVSTINSRLSLSQKSSILFAFSHAFCVCVDT